MTLRIQTRDEIPILSIFDGITAKPLVGERLSIQEVVLEPGAVAAVHTHDEEQVGYIVRGSCHFTDGERHWELGPGDCYLAPSGSPHGATALAEGCVIIDCFAPARAQIVELLAALED
jgi:quercetin dioxygenase-like cupin family protein